MAGNSSIEWTDKTYNPIVGCSIVSPGCTNCYAMRTAARMANNPQTPHYHGTVKSSKAGPVWTGKIAMASDATLLAPMRWRNPCRIFVNSMGDLFHESIPDEWIDKVFAVMALCPQHTFQVLTKRAERMREYLSSGSRWVEALGVIARLRGSKRGPDTYDHALGAMFFDGKPLPNVWLGVSCERQQEADERIPLLLQTPAAVRFISAEPLLGPINLKRIEVAGYGWQDVLEGWRDCKDYPGRENILDWVIVGGESGPNARPMHPNWARQLRHQCETARVPFFFKQWGAWGPDDGPAPGAPDRIMNGDVRCAWWTGRDWRYEVNGYAVNLDESKGSGEWVYRLGKKAAGRRLDDKEHNVFPVIEGRESQPGLSLPDSKQTEDATA